MVGTNIVQNDKKLKFLETINDQNYTNYHLVLTEDGGTEDSFSALINKVKSYPRLKTRTTLIKSQERIGVLGNKYLSISNHCQEGSIIFDLDINDYLFGKQVMKLISHLYQTSDSWIIYSNYLWRNFFGFFHGRGREIPSYVKQPNKYRIDSDWVTTPLRTYRR